MGMIAGAGMTGIDRRGFLRLAGCGAALTFWPAGCGRDEPVRRSTKYSGPARHVVLISLDTTRRDHFGCYGNPWIHTPRIDELASESILFTDYMTVVPTTLASHAALFTGKYPHSHGTPRNGFVVNPENAMLTEILRDAGFDTAGFVGSFVLARRFGFSQGFDHFDDDYQAFAPKIGVSRNQRSARSVTDAAIEYIETTGVPDNLFLFAHYFDPHAPYVPPAPYHQMYTEDAAAQSWLVETQDKGRGLLPEDANRALLYAGEISFMDEHVGRLLDYLRKRGILDEAVVVVTSDHGENFTEHFRHWDHGHTVYQTTMQAVCMIRLPGGDKRGEQVPQLFASIDLLPTLLRYLGLAIPEGIDGEALDVSDAELAFAAGPRFGQATKPFKRAETDPRWHNMQKARCIRTGHMKYIQTPYRNTQELYDLSADPHERRNLLEAPAPDNTATAEDLRHELTQWAASADPLESHFTSIQEDDTTRRLKALGYLEEPER